MKRLYIFLIVIIVSVCAGTYAHSFGSVRQFSFGLFSSSTPAVSKAPLQEPTEKNGIRFVGDIMLGRNVETKIKTYGSMYPLSALPQQPHDEYLVGNFEAAIPKDHVQTKDFSFSLSVDAAYVGALAKYGFTDLGLANNHSYDFGAAAYANTVSVLQAASTTPFGDPEHIASSTIPVITIGTSTRVALIPLYAVYTDPTDAELQTLMDRAKAVSDIQIVFIHWGVEYHTVHSQRQEALAHELIDLGADAIVGHHPHVVEDIGEYKNVPIFYSLGNFIFDQYFSKDVQQGLMLDMRKNGRTLSFLLLPVSSINSHAAPYLLTAYEKDTFLKELAQKSSQSLAKMIIAGKIDAPLQ